MRQGIIEKAQKENNRLCDVSRGCYTVLEDHQSKCTHCLHQARIRDRKREDQKRQDPTLCLDCGSKLTEETRAKGKHNKSLKRCVPCYEKLQKYESQRPPRERNYQAEAYTNKHVLWNHYVKGAQKRKIDFTLSKAKFQDLILHPCFYCKYTKDGEVNGLDRLNNNEGYTEENCVACCSTCNMLKGPQHPQEFIDKLSVIHKYVGKEPISSEMVHRWSTTYMSKSAPTYVSYQKSANTRNIAFAITEPEFLALIKQSCYMCGLPSSDTNNNGIDRFDNSKGYLLNNCRPCCGHCNLLKKDIPYNTILEKAATIVEQFTHLTAFICAKNIPIRLSKVEPRIRVVCPLVQEPVASIHKPLNEIIVPKEETCAEIQQILEKPIRPVKQWKSKQIFELIQEGEEETYRAFCESNNRLFPTWQEDWSSFILSVKGKTFEQTEGTIRTFLENLRRIRHNELCAKKKNIVSH